MPLAMTGQSGLRRLGTTLEVDGVTFCVWAPHAEHVSVVGTFNNWNGDADPMTSDGAGYWKTEVAGASIGDHYKYQIVTSAGVIQRIDPHAREVTNSVGNAIIHNPAFGWDDDCFKMPAWNELVIYELHVGTFNDDDSCRPGQFITITARLDHLQKLGINAIQIMPVGQFAGMRSWG